MLTEFKIPVVAENITSGIVTKIFVKVGETVKKDQNLLELETEKAVIEVPSPVSGTIKEILIKEGVTVRVGELVMKIDSGATEAQEPVKGKPKLTTVPHAPAESVAIQEPLAESFSAPKPEPVKTGPLLTSLIEPPVARKDVPAAPSVRKFAREIGIDIGIVPSTGAGGRISIEDVKAFAKQLNTGALKAAPTGSGQTAQKPLPDFSKLGTIERKPMNSVRLKTTEHLTYAWATIPHVTQFDKADITELEKLRKRYSAKVEKNGGKLTITAFVLKVVASALKNFPQFNTSLDLSRNEIIYKKYFHIGVAVDTDRGLLVPVIRDVDKKNILELAVELNQMAEKARTRKTTIEEMQGGTFTITNLGGIGGTYFTPIINAPEAAILGLSRAVTESVYLDGHFIPRLMLPLSLSYDHRLVDGADGARFIRWITEAIQQPFLMDLEG